ncbi:MBL fold metallo-hydrolase [Andreprevotia chitinilytica]|uniref:MBL fold metallo-hydrolase n=1 Tax=Andreprevotia chitinilytica TaxID=396808 RepID=UPI000550A307|nr:MBL fold metallo-hydrolase [Andreprevotia chitinilytica]
MFQKNFARTLIAASLTLGVIASAGAAGQPLKLAVYNPGDKGIFAVSSELITGQKEAVLVDAQFAKADAEQLVKMIKDSGKTLTTVYISHSDPDFYFGLDVIKAAFPKARIVATPQTVAAIKASMEGKLQYWGPILKDNAPKSLVLPDVLKGNTIKLEGKTLEIVGLNGPSPDRTFVWAPSLKAAFGGVVVFGQEHVWVADTQTPQSRQNWFKVLDKIEALKPTTVVPGHFAAGAPQTVESVQFTRDYLQAFEQEAAKAKDSAELIAAIKARYPTLSGAASLEISAKVIKGEMKWPQ